MKARNVDVGDAGPADFIRWLDTAPEDEIQRLIELMRDFEHDARDTMVAFGSGPHMQDLWQLRQQVEEANDKTREARSKGGRKGTIKLVTKGDATKAEALRVALAAQMKKKFAKATRNQIADEVSNTSPR
jgi:hypothetical protein